MIHNYYMFRNRYPSPWSIHGTCKGKAYSRILDSFGLQFNSE